MTALRDDTNAFIEIFETPLTGHGKGPLAGHTGAIKDNFDIAGHVTGNGNPYWRKAHPAAAISAPAVERLLSAGAALIGKTHMDEFAYSLMGNNAHYGTPVNSAARDRVPGGSSSGSASAVAAGVVDFALGTDTGGSVRLPASFCGIYGMRPSHNVIPLDGVVPLAPVFDTVGWFARDAGMLARVGRALGLMDIDGFHRAWLPSDLWEAVDPGVRAVLQPATDKIAARLASVTTDPLPLPTAAERAETFRVCQGRDAWTALGSWISANDAGLGPDIAARFAGAKAVDDEAFAGGRASRAGITAAMNAALDDGVLMIIPTAPGPAPLRNASPEALEAFRKQAIGILSIAGLAGLPQISIPGASIDGAPIGISVVGKRGSDAALLSFVEAL